MGRCGQNSREKIKKFFLKKNNLVVICTIISVTLSVIISFPLMKMNLSVKTIYCISMPGKILMNLLKLMILPLLVLSLLSGLVSLNIKTSSKLGLYTIVYYVLTTFLAVCLGMLLVVMIHPGNKSIGKNYHFDIEVIDPVESILDLLHNLFPENIISSTFRQVEIRFVNESIKRPTRNTSRGSSNLNYKYYPKISYINTPNFLGLIFFSIFLGTVLNTIGSRADFLISLINTLNLLIMKMVEMILVIIPIGIFFLVLSNLLNIKDVENTLRSIGLFTFTVLTGLIIHMFIILPTTYIIFTRKNPYGFMLGMSRAIIVAFVTQSSSATLPVTMECAEKNNKIDSRITKFMFPIGAIINMDGTGLYEAVAAIFIAQINGIPLSAIQLVRISFTATLAAIGAATVPSASLVTLPIVLATAGLPTHQVGLLYTFDWFLDRCRTSVNILGDAFGGGIVQSLCKKDLKISDYSGRHSLTNL